MHTHPIVKELEELWREHSGNPKSAIWRGLLDDFRSLIPAKLDELAEEHFNDGRFGMSKAGGCTRAATLKLLGAESEPFSGSQRVTFFFGHVLEVLGIASLRALGYRVEPTSEEGKQHIARIDPFMHSASDALMALTKGGEIDTILSMKSTGYKKSGKSYKKGGAAFMRYGFAQYPFDGVLKTSPGHYAQLQAEMHAHGIKQALEVVVAKDMILAMKDDPFLMESGSLTWYAELIPYNKKFVEAQLLPVWKWAWENVQKKEPGEALVLNGSTGLFVAINPASEGREPNASITGTYNPCDYCDLKRACAEAKEKEKAA